MRISSSLSNRIFLACTLIAAVPLGFAFYLINARAVVEVEAELHRRLSEEATLAVERHQTVTETFTLFARLIADLPKLKAAVDTGDPPTVQPLADEYRAEVNAGVLVLTSPRGEILGASGPDARRLAAWTTGHATVLAEATFDEESRLMRQPRGLLQAIRVPILLAGEPAELLGHLTLGYFLDDQLATQFKRLTGSEIAFVADGTVLASSLPSSARQALLALAPEDGFAAATIGNEEFIVVSRPLETGTGAAVPVVAASDVPRAPALLILRSRTERLRLLNTIRAGLGGALVVTLLLATILSYAVARTMTRPLATVTRAMSEVAATGDLTRKVLVRSGAWDDEDARLLGTAFNRLTESVARFQKDAAQRDRLSSLGRLSTVIAHEIRNPLMIVRASLAELRRDQVTAAEIREAVADIDEETMRLNRLVTDVLDFAKPLRFDLADTDVNAVCRASTAAAFVGDEAPEACLALAADLPRIVTDAERLRTALVNVLTNARQAVAERVRDRAAGSQGVALMEEADVIVQTAIEAGGVTISVRDRGTGIPRQDLGHIFDPYYTTRRGGTGLGLAITKNIIEGLGGSISITAPAEGGTEVQILLPAVPPGASA